MNPFMLLQVAGAGMSAVGSFYQAKSQQHSLRGQANAADYNASIQDIAARQAGVEADSVREAGQKQIGQYTMRAGQIKAGTKASLAARGIQAGVGSAAEIMQSQDLIKEIDVLAINSNAVRASEALKTQRVNAMNQAMLSRVSAQNLRAQAKSINPWLGVATSLLGSAANIGSQWAYANRGQGQYAQQADMPLRT